MQILFYMGLIGMLFTTVTFINTSVTVTAMQKKKDQIEKVEEMFADVEFAINNNILLKELDLSQEDLTDLLFVSELVPWNLAELQTDPWGIDYRVITANSDQVIYADTDSIEGSGINNSVTARLTAFAIVSAGPDGVFGDASTALPSTYNGIRSFTPDNATAGGTGEDDLFTTFSTYPAAVKMWNKIKQTHDKVKSVSLNYYSEQMEMFQNEIEAYYSGLGVNDVFDSSGNYTLADNAWMAALNGQPGFPEMTEDLTILGVSGEVDSLNVVGIAVDISNVTTNYDSVVDVMVTNPNGGISNEWDIDYGNTIRGSSLTVGSP